MYIDYQEAAKYLFRYSEKVTSLSVQKLLYLAHGLMLAKYDKPLIRQSFQAWKYGPIIEPLYHELKIFGASEISHDSFLIEDWYDINPTHTEEINCLQSIINQFGKLPAFQLVNITRANDSPWDNVFNSKNLNIDIHDEDIKEYFKRKLKTHL